MFPISCRGCRFLGLLAGAAALWSGLVVVTSAGPAPNPPFKVTIRDDKEQVAEDQSAVDPTKRINLQQTAMNLYITDVQAGTLQRVHFPMFHIDGSAALATTTKGKGIAGEVTVAPLPKSAGGKERTGFRATLVRDDLTITMTSELVPSKSRGAGQKRQRDAVFIRYHVENKGSQSHKFGMRIALSPRLLNNLGCLFAGPHHDKVLDGVELKDGQIPDHLRILERPNPKNPGLSSVLALHVGGTSEKPDRLILTRYAIATRQWEMKVAPANGGASLIGVYWEPRELKPGAKREFAYGFGKGIATSPEGDCRFRIQLGGSFEPGKLFTVSAVVEDPSPGQTLTLELPPGMQRVEGKQIQPIPEATTDQGQIVILWKARVLHAGDFALRVRSSTGLIQTKLIAITKN